MTRKVGQNTHAYIARWKTCDCIAALCVDEVDYPKDVAKAVAGYIRRGYRVERQPLGSDYGWHCTAHPKGTPAPWDIEKAAKRRGTAPAEFGL